MPKVPKKKILVKPNFSNITWKGQNIKQIKYTAKFTKKDVQSLADKIKNNLILQKNYQNELIFQNYLNNLILKFYYN